MFQRVLRRRLVASVLPAVFWFVGSVADAAVPNFYANVSASGVLVNGSRVTGVTHLAFGQYEVTFNANVSACAYLATTVQSATQALTVFTAGGHSSPNGVYVETKNQGGGLSDAPFNLVVICGGTGTKFAVVDYGGGLVRGSLGTSVTSPGPGQYNVAFSSSVSSCAFIATVGDPAADLVFNPAGVYTASGATSNVVYVETKNPGGGLEAGVPFHLAAICSSAPRMKVAVVDPTGLAKRGSSLTSAFRASTGLFAVVTSINIATCATVATRGSVAKAVPFTPATVERLSGPAANTVGLEMRDLLFFGGNLLNEAFHAAAVCP